MTLSNLTGLSIDTTSPEACNKLNFIGFSDLFMTFYTFALEYLNSVISANIVSVILIYLSHLPESSPHYYKLSAATQ